MHAYLVDLLFHRGLEEGARWAGLPALILAFKLKSSEVTNNTRHRHRAISPRGTKIELELVVFHILVSANRMLHPFISCLLIAVLEKTLTV